MQSTYFCFTHWKCACEKWDVEGMGCVQELTPAVANPVQGHCAVSREKPHFWRFLQGTFVSMVACHGGCMSLALWVLISASPGLSLHPNPLGEHGCFSIFQGWELSTPVKAGGWFSVVTNENSTALTPLQMWQGHGANRNVLSQTKGHIFLKVQAQYDSIKLSSGPGCSRWFRVLGR